jgi:hypothetical protein
MSETGYREHMRELLGWLRSDLFEEVRAPIPVGPDTRAFRNPGGWVVLVSRREDRTGCSGGILDPAGEQVLVPSRLEVDRLDEMIP